MALDIEAHRADLLVDEYARMGFEARRADILVEKHTRMRFEGRSPDFLVIKKSPLRGSHINFNQHYYKEIAPMALDIEAHRADLLVDEYARMGL